VCKRTKPEIVQVLLNETIELVKVKVKVKVKQPFTDLEVAQRVPEI
jgi:hypothetical protein